MVPQLFDCWANPVVHLLLLCDLPVFVIVDRGGADLLALLSSGPTRLADRQLAAGKAVVVASGL